MSTRSTRATVTSIFITSLAMTSVSAHQEPVLAPEEAQLRAIHFMENLAHARTASVAMLRRELGAAAAPSQTSVRDDGDTSWNRDFGTIATTTSIANDAQIVVQFTGGCLHREFLRAHLPPPAMVWPPAPHTAPSLSFSYFSGGSTVTLSFPPESKCLMTAGIESDGRLRRELEGRAPKTQ